MKPKTLNITYWIVTILFAGVNLLSGISEFFPSEQALGVITMLGYPAYFLIILGIAKTLGGIAILQTKYKTVKEWAYAGFTFDYIAASMSFYFVNKDVMGMIVPLVFLGFLAVSYWLWKQREAKKNE